jgi:hypothetical protein
MTTVHKQIMSADKAICLNIDMLSDERELLSQNVLSQLRNLVEGILVCLHSDSLETTFHFNGVSSALEFVRTQGRFNVLAKFHKLLQKSASHYTMDGDNSERLMLKYYEYLHRVRSLLRNEIGMEILANLESFPIDLNPSLREYHEKIAERIESPYPYREDRNPPERYYIHKTRPFYCNDRIFYEITFCRAINKVNKFDRIIAFTEIDINDKHAAMLTLQQDSIQVLGQTMPITIIRQWEVSIRPCEFDNFARLLGMPLKAKTSSTEYRYIMHYLTTRGDSLLDIINMSENVYMAIKAARPNDTVIQQIFPLLDEARRRIKFKTPGHNVLRYLLLHMHNEIIKSQYNSESCALLSKLKLKYGCKPFDDMPFCTSLSGHNPRYWDLIESLDTAGRMHELLARRVKNNVEHHGILYTPVSDLEDFGDVATLVQEYNRRVYKNHTERHLMVDKGHVFVSGYENETVSIVESLQKNAALGINGYTQAVERWLHETPRGIDDNVKAEALKQLFRGSCVTLIYGAAGTGKSTMLDHIARYFNDKEKLFLAHTNPAIDNLQRKINAQNSEFRTIRSHTSKSKNDKNYDLLIIDECSTVSNSDLLKVLTKTSFKLLVLVGDVYQIESIQFGNWFGIIRSFIKSDSSFELMTPYRTQNAALLSFWSKVRLTEDDIAESIAQNGFSTLLNNTLFETQAQDEIILCLNYDGLYGINNINRFLQSSNPGKANFWRESTYKIGDPILFSNAERFRPVIYNNLKGWIVGIVQAPGKIQFDVRLDRPLSAFDVSGNVEITWIAESTIRFTVYDLPHSSDEDDDSLNTTVPFQVAYAVSIHKAQGLEYDSVKIVITDANEDNISHSIFYTAVTRTRQRLKIFWTPETQEKVLQKLKHKTNPKDVHLLKSRRNLLPMS